jgi:hypothetical protein
MGQRSLSALSSWYTCLVEHCLIAAKPVRHAHRPPMDRDTVVGIRLTGPRCSDCPKRPDAAARDRRVTLGPAHGHVVAARRDRVLVRE